MTVSSRSSCVPDLCLCFPFPASGPRASWFMVTLVSSLTYLTYN